MADSWDERKQALEDQYFDKQNQAALRRLGAGGQSGEAPRKRLSPVTGKPMEQVTLFGAVVDRCPDSGGIWLDAGELEEIIKNTGAQEDGGSRVSSFFKKLAGK